MGLKARQIFYSLRMRALVFRVVGHLLLAIIALLVPEVGPNRFLLATLLICFSPPIAVLINLYVDEENHNWVEALFDLLLVVTLVHLVPHLWVAALCLGLMVALAPSVSLHPASHWIYMAFGAIMLIGLTIAAWVHEVQDWGLPILAVAVTYPAMLYYTYTQMQRVNDLRQRAQLVRGMTELAGSVAHDFNNMLMSISGHAELAQLGLAKEHPAYQHVEEVLAGTERAGLLSGQLQSFSGRALTQHESTDVWAELHVMARMLRSVMRATVEIEPPTGDLCVNANLSQFHQVLINVLLNADEAMLEDAGVVNVRVERAIEQSTEGESRFIDIAISDRGLGIPENDLTSVYESLFTTKGKGHGWGLAGVRRIMHENNGSITIRARQGGGTDVVLRWLEALGPGSTSKTELLSEPTAQQRSGVVLIVDDEVGVREVASAMLEQVGFDTVQASDGEQAMAFFKSNHEHILAVVLDLKMSGMDGWSCLQRMRTLSAATPIIICSGFNPQDNLPTAAAGDPNLGFLRKPFRKAHLLSVVHGLLGLD